MKSIGMYLAIAGFGSLLLNLVGYEFSLLMWIDNWGITTGYAIRGAAIVAGVALFLIGTKQEQEQATAQESEQV